MLNHVIHKTRKTNFSGTDESVLLGFARVPERMWVALLLVPLRALTREGSDGYLWKVSLCLRFLRLCVCETLVFKLQYFKFFSENISHFAMHLV